MVPEPPCFKSYLSLTTHRHKTCYININKVKEGQSMLGSHSNRFPGGPWTFGVGATLFLPFGSANCFLFLLLLFICRSSNFVCYKRGKFYFCRPIYLFIFCYKIFPFGGMDHKEIIFLKKKKKKKKKKLPRSPLESDSAPLTTHEKQNFTHQYLSRGICRANTIVYLLVKCDYPPQRST